MSISWVAFHLTDRCQLNCDHCLRDPSQKALDLDVELIARVAREAAALFGVDHAGFTGGEPSLHPRFTDAIDAVVDAGYTWHLVTNGETFPRLLAAVEARPERLHTLTAINLSLDGATANTHDAIRGDGSFERVLSAASICAARGIRFRIQTAINARNVSEIEAIGLLGAQLGAFAVAFQSTVPTGTFLDRNLFMSPSEWRIAHRRMVSLRSVLAIEIDPQVGFPSDKPFVTCGPWLGDPLHVDVHGRLTLCCMHAGVPAAAGTETSDVAGDLNEMPLADAHLRLLAHVHELQVARALDLRERAGDPWMGMTCNWCMKAHGRPHWAESGAAGPSAARERWRGAWAPGYKRSHHEAWDDAGSPPPDDA